MRIQSKVLCVCACVCVCVCMRVCTLAHACLVKSSFFLFFKFLEQQAKKKLHRANG